MNKIYFREVQRYTQWWVWLLLLILFAVSVIPFWYGVYVQAVEGRPWGNDPITTDKLVVVAAIITLLVTAILYLFGIMKLETEVIPAGVRFRYYPFIRKWRLFTPDQIAHYSVEKYNPVLSYGGWGIRSGTQKQKIYTVSGNMALNIQVVDGSKIIVGTGRKSALKYAMEKMIQAKVADRNKL